MDGNSLTPQEEKLRQLKAILPEAFAEGKVDWDKLKATLGEDVHFSNERYVLNWAGKSDTFRVLQLSTKKTLIPEESQSVDFAQTGNIFIEGENLETLKVLHRSYFGKVKMIYIDPPYNTGNDSFVYPDKFAETKAEYAKRVGDIDEEGCRSKDWAFRKNSKENGQYHSNWLSMMYPRLFLAKSLLKEDGVIFISIDDHEVHNLRLIMDEIFGEENFVASVIWKKKHSYGRGQSFIIPQTEYVLCYAKDINNAINFGIPYSGTKINEFKLSDSRGKYRLLRLWHTAPRGAYERMTLQHKLYTAEGLLVDSVSGQWLWNKNRFKKEISQNNVVFKKQTNGSIRAFKKDYLNKDRQEKPTSLYDKATTDDATKEFNTLLPDVKETMFTKPMKLIKDIINWTNLDFNDIILDFFAGSGTTAHAVMQLNTEDGGNRKCISVQLPERIGEQKEACKAGYPTIADIAKERIRRAAKKIKGEIQIQIETKEKELTELQSQLDIDGKQEEIKDLRSSIERLRSQDLGFKAFKLADSNFKQWEHAQPKNAKAMAKQMLHFIDPVKKKSTVENMVYELLLKNGKELNCKLEHKGNYYLVNDDELVLMLEAVAPKMIDEIVRLKPQKIIALDKLFDGNDQLKTNTYLQMKDADIKFKTL